MNRLRCCMTAAAFFCKKTLKYQKKCFNCLRGWYQMDTTLKGGMKS